ncbi:MAG: hypothetical protein QOE70_2786 [Chthoniobacter sp.]|nr:hypothetical protein [Chthoniobacter sp.]
MCRASETRGFVRLAYLFSRYPIVSQTFCDTEILALERMGVEIELYSIYPPPTSFRHGHAVRIKAEVHYAPPQTILKLGEQHARRSGRWPEKYVADHERRYGKDYKANLRARNALYFADLFRQRGITHFHVHFANRAAQTALFIKELSGISFSVTTHGQDFMCDLGNDDLLREICREAEFVANETDFSRGLIARLCPDSVDKLVKVFNGMDLDNFPAAAPEFANEVPRIVAVGRLIEFKGFHHLVAACAELQRRKLAFDCEIIGEGPWREPLQSAIDTAGVGARVRLTGSLPQEEVFAKLRECDIFTLPCIVDRNNTSDVFPTVILEAMASAKPIVSTQVAGVPEQIVDGRTGLLVKPGDERGLADALARLVQSLELRQQFGQAARRRLEEEFAIERTVQPLKALYGKIVKPTTPPKMTAAGFAALLHEWPTGERNESELRQLREANPALRVYVALASALPAPESAHQTLSHLRFLPDGMVLEGEWQQEREFARRIEVWRQDLGQKLSSEFFLQQARYALFLRRWIARDGVRHVHAMTSRELLCGWMLRKLCGITLSVTIEEKNPYLPSSVIVQLAAECAGVRLSGEDLHDELTAQFKAAGQFLLRHRHGRAIEPEWLGKLRQWGSVNTH